MLLDTDPKSTVQCTQAAMAAIAMAATLPRVATDRSQIPVLILVWHRLRDILDSDSSALACTHATVAVLSKLAHNNALGVAVKSDIGDATMRGSNYSGSPGRCAGAVIIASHKSTTPMMCTFMALPAF